MFSVIERINKKSGNENERAFKEHLCKMNGISYYEVSANNHMNLRIKLKRCFKRKTYISFQTVKKILRNAKGLFQMERYNATVI